VSVFEAERDHPRARSESLLAERVGEDLVIYDELMKTAHCLQPDAAAIWERCDGRSSVREIAAATRLPHDTVVQAVQEFRSAGLLADGNGYSRREAAKRFAALGGAAVAAPLLMYSVPVGAAAAACSRPGCPTLSIGSNFNGTAVPAGDFIWFNAIMQKPSSTGTVLLVGSTITFSFGGTNFDLHIPDSVISFGGAASATFSGPTAQHPNGLWTIVSDFSANTFLGGFAWQVPAGGMPGGVNPVNWNFPIFAPLNDNFAVQWAAAAYTPPFDMSAANVLAEDAGGLHAGVPRTYEANVVGGARGGGGSNFTGSLSPTGQCTSTC
jgi:hypothetical protein